MNILGVEAATEAFKYMGWCCAVGVIAVYAKVGMQFDVLAAADGMTEISPVTILFHGHRANYLIASPPRDALCRPHYYTLS